MSYDPINNVVDESLVIDAHTISKLLTFRDRPKLQLLPGISPEAESQRLASALNELADKLIVGIGANNSKRWVLKQFQPYLKAAEVEDTEGREHFGTELEQIMDIVGIDSSDGLLSFYLGGL